MLRDVRAARCAMTWLLFAMVAFALSLPGVIPKGLPWQNFTETCKSLILWIGPRKINMEDACGIVIRFPCLLQMFYNIQAQLGIKNPIKCAADLHFSTLALLTVHISSVWR